MRKTIATAVIFMLVALAAGRNPMARAEEPETGARASRDTTTGRVFENMVEAALKTGGYDVRGQVLAGTRPNGCKHMVDLVARKDGKAILVSLKWQQAAGTAEQKVPYEIICLAEALEQSRTPGHKGERYDKACIVMGGTGWTLRDWYLSGGLKKHLPAAGDIGLYPLETFVGLANQGKL
jgi:hypothetical protein